MRALALLVSVGVHVAVVVTTPRGRSTQRDVERSDSEPTPVELIDARDLVPQPAIETPPPAPLAEPDPDPDPEPPKPEPEPAPPPRPKPRVRPQAAPSPAPAPPSVAVPDTDTDPDTAGPTGDGSDPRAEPRRLALTLSNRGAPKPNASSDPKRASRARSAKPACDQPNTKPRPRTKVPVRYTRAARTAGLHGRLILRATVDTKGAVTHVEVLRSIGPEVDEPATAALRAWTFDPATACGRPVAGRFTIARDFTLAD
ncbi:MAG: TonB family protein [Myxococcota bacterium]